MKIVSFNVNGLRARLHQLEVLIKTHSPDIIGVQEIKVADEDFPLDAIESLGYHAVFHGQKTHYGVALFSKNPPLSVQKGFPSDTEDAQRRIIIADYPMADGTSLRVINGYFPQGENRSHEVKFPAKEKFYADLQQYLQSECSPKQPLVLMGDFNIAHQNFDIGIGADNAKRWIRTGKCSFLPEEREWFDTLLGWGLTDCFRQLNPDTSDLFSWFDYRSRGFDREPRRGLRIDGILASASMAAACNEVIFDYEIRGMEKPSDHVPVIASFITG